MPDYMFLLESRLSPEQRAVMMRVQELAAAMGFNLYLTGGTVRDLITGASLRDLDFTVEGNPSKMARELEKGGAKILRGRREAAAHRSAVCRRRGRQHFGGARRSLRAAGDAAGDSLVDDHGGFAAAGFFAERDCDLAESGVARIAARSDEWIVGHRARRSAGADDSQLYESAGAVAAGAAVCGADGIQAGGADAGMV